MDQLPRLGKRELVCLLLFTRIYVVSVWRGFLFFWVLGMGYVILLWHSLSRPYNYFESFLSPLNVPAESFLHQGLSEPEFYGDLVYKFKKIRGMTDFSDQFRKIIMRYKRIGYNLNVMRQSACLVINPITVDGYATLFNYTPVDRASDSMMAPT